jgi:hypothetical protein
MGSKAAESGEGNQDGHRGSGEPKLSLGGELFATDSSVDGGALSTNFFEISDDSADDDDDDGQDLGVTNALGAHPSMSAIHGVSDEYTCGPVIAEPELQVRRIYMCLCHRIALYSPAIPLVRS